MDRVFTVMQKIAQEEMKTLETQHLFESTRNEHALYTRHILHLKVGPDTVCLLVGWLLNVPATCECISGTDLLRQLHVLPH